MLMILVYEVQPWFMQVFVSTLCLHQVALGKNTSSNIYNFCLSQPVVRIANLKVTRTFVKVLCSDTGSAWLLRFNSYLRLI